MYKILICILLLTTSFLYGQDSTKVLQEIEVQAYRYNRPIADVPVSVSVLRPADFARFDNSSLVQAANTVPGVRMEERSPGSYRFSIRGSLIRSPFGVRNVKVYWNGLPLTDGGGNTYLNVIDPSSMETMEIIKGPGGSLYGANTGGVILLKGRYPKHNSLEVSEMIGSYGLNRFNVGAEFANSQLNGSLNYARQNSQGYRNQTRFRRDVANTNWSFVINKSTMISALLFASDVFYETPGGLTKSEYDADARQARPAAGQSPGAEAQDAHVRNKTIFGGMNVARDWNAAWTTQFGVFFSYNDFENFAIRNYEQRFETNFGGRLENQYAFGDEQKGGKISFGAEAISMLSPVNVYQNISGEPVDQQIGDDLASTQYLFFLQTEFFFPNDLSLTLGASSNHLNYTFERTIPAAENQDKSFNAVLTPRIAVLKKIGDHFSVFASASKGFSPPTLAEVRPSADTFNEDLKPERGVSYEIGVKSNFGAVDFDVSAYAFNLKETIVLQRLPDGAEYFINAGETMQRGVEVAAAWAPATGIKVWSSYSYNYYRFKDYVKYDQGSGENKDYSANKMTGVPPTTFILGLDLSTKKGVYANCSASYTDHIPLDDGNTEYAGDYILAGLRVGYRTQWFKKVSADLFCGVNNLLDEKYSLGNDLNAINGRYYNVAPDRNFYLGLKLNLPAKK